MSLKAQTMNIFKDSQYMYCMQQSGRLIRTPTYLSPSTQYITTQQSSVSVALAQ